MAAMQHHNEQSPGEDSLAMTFADQNPLGDYVRETWIDNYAQREYYSILNFESATLLWR
jgi:hypothetical protein